jgi:carboxylesterase
MAVSYDEKTAPFSLGKGDRACLLIHGFTGSPWDLRPLGEALAKEGYAVRAIRLSGHGQSPEAMLAVSHRDWKRECETALKELAEQHSIIFLIGLSMGALLSILLTAQFPERVRGLVLLAPAVRIRGPAVRLLRATRSRQWIPAIIPWIRKTGTDIADPRELADSPILPRFPSRRLYDLWALQDLALASASSVKAPALILIAKHDRVVDNRAARQIGAALTSSPSVEIVELTNGRHIIPRDYSRAEGEQKITSFLSKL